MSWLKKDSKLIQGDWKLIFCLSQPGEGEDDARQFLQMLRMKLKTKLNTMDVMIVAFFEVAHSAGTALLFTIAFPEMDSVRGALATNALCWFPGFLLMMKLAKENTETWKKILKTGLTLVSLLLQITALAWPVIWGLDNGSDFALFASLFFVYLSYNFGIFIRELSL